MLVMEGVLHILTHGRTSNRVKYPALHWVTLGSAFYPLPILFRQCHKHYPFMDNQLKYRLLVFHRYTYGEDVIGDLSVVVTTTTGSITKDELKV